MLYYKYDFLVNTNNGKQHALFSALCLALKYDSAFYRGNGVWYLVLLFFVSQSEPSIFIKYQAKPQLLGGDTKDESLFSLPLPVGKSKGLSKQFEEKKRRATDQSDRYTYLLRGWENSCFPKEAKCTINNQIIQF